ncbi:MAG: SDR family NAD(P)-dependent oxidoreductase [Aestuariivirga sp.]
MTARAPWQRVWIIGASTGIGAEVARQLAQKGAIVAASARSAEKLEAHAARNPGIRPYPLDVTNEADVASCFARIEADLGAIDLVLVASGAYAPLSVDEFKVENFRATYGVNYMGVIHVLAAVLPTLLNRHKGHVAWIASVSGYRGLPKAAAYGPTKAALINLAESLKPELGARGIDVSVINPGFVRTPMTAVNDFDMPFLMEPEDAARLTIEGLAAKKFEIAYPRRFVAILKFARLLPYPLYFWLIRKFVMK